MSEYTIVAKVDSLLAMRRLQQFARRMKVRGEADSMAHAYAILLKEAVKARKTDAEFLYDRDAWCADYEKRMRAGVIGPSCTEKPSSMEEYLALPESEKIRLCSVPTKEKK